MTNLIILLSCLSMIESGDDDRKIGAKGEVSAYQILPAVWNQFSPFPIRLSVHPKSANITASIILNYRREMFRRQEKREPTPREIYILWNAPAQAMSGKISKRVMEKAKRFENLVNEKVKEKTK